MIRSNQLSTTIFFSALLLGTAGCGGQTDQTKQTAAQEQKPPVLLDRYELREIRNGSYFGTALLDRQTGRVWTLDATSKAGQATTPAFVEVPINPRPETTTKVIKYDAQGNRIPDAPLKNPY